MVRIIIYQTLSFNYDIKYVYLNNLIIKYIHIAVILKYICYLNFFDYY